MPVCGVCERNVADHDCTDCGRPARVGGRQCAACYQRRYRTDPARRARHREAVKAYTKRNPAKRRRWVRTYQARVGLYVPDLQALRAAIKRLDAAVAIASERASLRGTGEPGGNDGAEW